MRDHITCDLNGERTTIRNVAATTTVLEWLRDVRRETGTKEGCGAGDCGACTIVVGELDRGGARVTYRPMNACIAFVPHLEGKIVVTVEGLAGPGGTLHPVQQAMVNCHGSQCGYCTPGVVMSLYALYLTHDAAPARDVIVESLGGNLCRCTGYGPIIDAAERMFTLPRAPWDGERRTRDLAAMKDMTHNGTVALAHADGSVQLPATLDALCNLAAAAPDATILSGATDAGLWVTKQERFIRKMIGTSRVADSAFTSVTDIVVDGEARRRAGGGVRIADLYAEGGSLAELIARFAGPQVRASGTIGGNIANGSPIGDLAPALMAMNGAVTLRHGRSERRVPLDAFFISYGRQDRRPGEVLVSVDWAVPAVDDFAIHKVSKRFEDDISAVCGAFNISVRDGVITSARIAFGGMAATPKRATTVEAALRGKPWTRAAIEAAMNAFELDFKPIDDMRASAAYRIQVAKNLLLRVFLERTSSSGAMRLTATAAE